MKKDINTWRIPKWNVTETAVEEIALNIFKWAKANFIGARSLSKHMLGLCDGLRTKREDGMPPLWQEVENDIGCICEKGEAIVGDDKDKGKVWTMPAQSYRAMMVGMLFRDQENGLPAA